MSIGRNVPKATIDAPPLQWGNGKTVARPTSTGRWSPFVGWHLEIGQDEEIDRALHELVTPRVEIKHQRPGGFEVKQHWSFGETIRVYPITAGPPAPTAAGCIKAAAATATAGLGLRWRDGERSRMAVRCYAEPLVLAGLTVVVQIAARSRMTDELLKALVDHVRACEAADDLIDRAKHPDLVTLHEIALPLVAGDEAEWGSGDTTAVIPFRSDHPETIDADYLQVSWRPGAIHAAAVNAWPAVQAWAATYAAEPAESY